MAKTDNITTPKKRGMMRSFHFRLYPNSTQRVILERILSDNCETYNAALQERKEAWRFQRKSIKLLDQMKELTELRQDPAFQWMACEIQREPLRRIDRAFKSFFRRCRTGEKPGFPRFRSLDRYNSFSFGIDPRERAIVRGRKLKLPNIGDVRIRGGRVINGRAKVCRIRREGVRWTASIVCDIGPAPRRCLVSSPIGVDVGLTDLATLSDGTVIENPRWIRQHEIRIAAAQRKLALKRSRSRNRVSARETLRRTIQRTADARRNYLHHVSKKLVIEHDLIAHENLKIGNMVRSSFGKSILDAAWGELIHQLTYKAEKAGRWVVAVNPRGTSQKCSGCGAVVKKKLSERTHSCVCGLTLDRDHNAGLNILALGMSAAGLQPSEFAQTTACA